MRGDYGFHIASYYHQLGGSMPSWEFEPDPKPWRWRSQRWRVRRDRNVVALRQRQAVVEMRLAEMRLEDDPWSSGAVWGTWP